MSPVDEDDVELAARIRELEQRLLSPVVRSSEEALSELLGDDFLELGASGRTFDLTAIIDELRREQSSLDYRIEDFSVRRLSPDVVMATYRLSVDAERRRVTLRSSVWVHRDDRWQLVFHQGTPTPEARHD